MCLGQTFEDDLRLVSLDCLNVDSLRLGGSGLVVGVGTSDGGVRVGSLLHGCFSLS